MNTAMSTLCCRSSWSMGELAGMFMRIFVARSDTRRQILDTASRALYRLVAEVVTVSEAGRLAALERAGLVHPRAGAVTAPLFGSGGFFLAADKVQAKYEMLRAHLAAGDPVTRAAAAHGYSRAAFYLVAAAFEQAGMAGLLDERRGRRGPVKLRGEIAEFIRSAPDASGAALAAQVADRFGVVLHRRTIERA